MTLLLFFFLSLSSLSPSAVRPTACSRNGQKGWGEERFLHRFPSSGRQRYFPRTYTCTACAFIPCDRHSIGHAMSVTRLLRSKLIGCTLYGQLPDWLKRKVSTELIIWLTKPVDD
ncbi:hypothetical protein F5Y00DRAFT_246384 [Daldinia vernicosa]|uniref:uncharacterized protein n=1 Tax=Daldinia vernicosa TaxID=114800 RepID=UPI002007BE41|nr:uncharacterized protein F5Y00DRAFT_246384 [Daldinia vernicosa]KAI0845353.1 hypothetical protein F5Y00DRAFT_246384 [Daldinia vernicosa]